jgi:hypothetical protein
MDDLLLGVFSSSLIVSWMAVIPYCDLVTPSWASTVVKNVLSSGLTKL